MSIQIYKSDSLKYLQMLSHDFPNQAAASSEIINREALMKLPKGTEHFITDLHGEHEAFVHILNSASGVIREKVDQVLKGTVTENVRADLSTLIYYPVEKLPYLKEQFATRPALEEWYGITLMQLIDICRLVSSKHTRDYVRKCLPKSGGYIMDELLHAHFEDHNKDRYYGQIVGSIIEHNQADQFIIWLCELIKRLAVDKLHVIGDVFDRGPHPDIILDKLMKHHDVDVQWGNHDVVWMGAASGSPLCICTVLKTTLSYNNHTMLEDSYGINLRHLLRFAEQTYGKEELARFQPHVDEARGPYSPNELQRCAAMHKAITIMMFKLECAVIDRNPEFDMGSRDYIRHIDYANGTVVINGVTHELRDKSFPTVDPADPARLSEDEVFVLRQLVDSFRNSEKLQRHIAFLYAKGSAYLTLNNNLLYHGSIPLNEDGSFAEATFEGKTYSGRALLDYCDTRARKGYFAPMGSDARVKGQDFLWYLWCGRLSPMFGKSAMTTFERLYITDKSTHTEVMNPYYTWYNDETVCRRILAEFGLTGDECHIVNGHVPVKQKKGESPIKGNGRLLVIDGGFCRAYHEKTGIAGYTLVYSSRGMSLRTHQPFESAEKAIRENEDILPRVEVVDRNRNRVRVGDTDEGVLLRERVRDLQHLVEAYQNGLLKESRAEEHIW